MTGQKATPGTNRTGGFKRKVRLAARYKIAASVETLSAKSKAGGITTGSQPSSNVDSDKAQTLKE